MVLEGVWDGLATAATHFAHLITPLGLRVTEAAGIRLSTRKMYKVATLEWKLDGLVLPDVEFDIANRSGRSRAVRCCRDISQNPQNH